MYIAQLKYIYSPFYECGGCVYVFIFLIWCLVHVLFCLSETKPHICDACYIGQVKQFIFLHIRRRLTRNHIKLFSSSLLISLDLAFLLSQIYI